VTVTTLTPSALAHSRFEVADEDAVDPAITSDAIANAQNPRLATLA